ERVIAWLRRFTDFLPYEHRVSAHVAALGRCVPLPVNRDTINAVFGEALDSAAAAEEFLARIAVPTAAPANAAEYLQSRIGTTLTDLFFRPYTLKMWGLELEQMAAAVVQRIPLRFDTDDRYFPTETHQGLPRDGYAALVARILDHPKIRISLDTHFDKQM